ncbi:MAG: nucleotidyltransferase family protein [bacterium]|nr:nucleotidyltransferase family protein [bacterium]
MENLNPITKAIILAAGRGTRMRHLTEDVPKPLLKVGGKPFLDIIFDALPESIREVIVVIGYRKDLIRNHLGTNYKGKKIDYVVQEKLTGTGHAVLLTKDLFDDGERFLVFYGDELIAKNDVDAVLEHDLGWLCWEVVNPKASGIVTVTVEGLITEIVEKPKKPKSKLGVGGLISLNADIFNYVPDQHETGEYYLTDMMNQFLKDHKVHVVIGKNRPSFSSPEDISAVHETD